MKTPEAKLFESFPWTCPFCHRDTTIVKSNTTSTIHFHFIGGSNNEGIGILTNIIQCPNPNCSEYAVTAAMYKAKWKMLSYGRESVRSEEVVGEPLCTWQLRPSSSAIPQPEYIPKAIREDYKEACAIVELSPKAAATLARRCLQGMIRNFWGIKGKNLQDEIDQLKGKVENSTWNSIDAVRKIGNIGAHMAKDVNLIIDIEPDEAQLLIQLIEYLFCAWYVARHEREEQDARLLKIVEEKESLRSKPSG